MRSPSLSPENIHEYNSDDIICNNESDHSSSVCSYASSFPPGPPPLLRELNLQKWYMGYEHFMKLYSMLKVWYIITYVFPLYLIGISIIVIPQFTINDFYWYCLCIPIIWVIMTKITYNVILFNYTPRISKNKLSYYPGNKYEYGCVIYCIYHPSVEQLCEYQYWVVMNPTTHIVEFISVKNELYNKPITHNVLMR